MFHQPGFKAWEISIEKLLIDKTNGKEYQTAVSGMESYFFNLRKGLFQIFLNSHFLNHTLAKNKCPVFVNMKLVFLLANWAN